QASACRTSSPYGRKSSVARNNPKAIPEERRNLIVKIYDSMLRNRPKNVRDLGLATLKSLPTSISSMRSFMNAMNLKHAQGEVLEGLKHTVVIVGQANSGKSSLFNMLKGEQISPVSAEEGTTRTLVRADFGPFTLIDTPGHLPERMEEGMEEATVIVLLIDATKGLQDKDRDLYGAIKKLNKPTIIAVNKVDTLKGRDAGDELANEIAVQLETPGIIPVSARTGENIAGELIPAMIEASPDAALVIGRELPAFRRASAQRIIRNATLASLVVGLEPIPLIDIPILLGTQIRLVLRLGALYGEEMDSTKAMKHARELLITIAGGAGMRILAEQAAKAVPIGGDFVAGAIAGAATYSIGQVALEYYDGGKRISPSRLRDLYSTFYQRFRNQRSTEDWKRYALNGVDAPLEIDMPRSTPETTEQERSEPR
ncbi:MAG TPA: GTP-binding protein, partial [Ktedonobacteraceae bacterium]|nr:GTP-binding protein [Ktedonobacteraceae bacterium]